MKKIRRFEPQILGQPKSKIMALQYPITQSPRKEEYGATGELKILRSILKRDFRGEVIVKPYKCTRDGSQNIDQQCMLIEGVIPFTKICGNFDDKEK